MTITGSGAFVTNCTAWILDFLFTILTSNSNCIISLRNALYKVIKHQQNSSHNHRWASSLSIQSATAWAVTSLVNSTNAWGMFLTSSWSLSYHHHHHPVPSDQPSVHHGLALRELRHWCEEVISVGQGAPPVLHPVVEVQLANLMGAIDHYKGVCTLMPLIDPPNYIH